MDDYAGPRKIVVLGGGIGGLAAADAITEALAEQPDPLPEGIEVVVLEGARDPGGRAQASWLTDDPSVRHRHPHAPYGTSTPHGLHFVWGSYTHFLRWVRQSGVGLTPGRGTSTYCLWMAPPDIPGDGLTPGRVVALHVCDPERPDNAWNPNVRALLRAARQRSPAITWLEHMLGRVFLVDVSISDWLSYLDILFDEDNLTPQLRWMIFLSGIVPSVMGQPETNEWLRSLLGGRRPQDVDVADLARPLFEKGLVVPRMRRAQSVFGRFLGREPEPDRDSMSGRVARAVRRQARAASEMMTTAVGGARPLFGSAAFRGEGRFIRTPLPPIEPSPGPAEMDGGATSGTVAAVAAFARLLVTDSALILSELSSYDPRDSGYAKNILKLAFSSPYGLDVATAVRDAQFGLQSHDGSVLQTFDGDDARTVWNAVRDRIDARFEDGSCPGRFWSGTWGKTVRVNAGRVTAIDVANTAEHVHEAVPMVDPVTKGPTTGTLDADAVVSNLVPQCLWPIVKGATDREEVDFLRTLRRLGSFMNETVNLQLFLPDRLELPFVEPPQGSDETPPFSISNLEGPFTILADLRRCWSSPAFQGIRLSEPDPGEPFDGTAWELVGSWADMFTHDPRAHGSRYQWPLAIQQVLASLCHDPADFEPGSVDRRPWPHAGDGNGHVSAPVFGQVRPDRREAYRDRWRREVEPLVVSQALLQLAALPGLAVYTRDALEDRAHTLSRGDDIDFCYVLTRNCHAENKFFSAEPGTHDLRPHARFETPIRGLWVAGDWTRNGCNGQSMESALVSGLQAAYGVIEAIRAGGLTRIRPPVIDQSIMPSGAWDNGP